MKRLCMLLCMAMLITSCMSVSVPSVAFADETAKADFFDTDANIGLYNQTQTDAHVENANDAERGNVFFVDSDVAKNSVGIGKAIGTGGINTGKVVLGADVKLEADTVPRFGLRFTTKKSDGKEAAHMVAWVGTGKKALLTRGDGGEAGLGSQYDTGTKPDGNKAAAAIEQPVGTDKWVRVEVVVDFDNQSRSLYVDGKLVETRAKNEDSSLFTSIYDEKIIALVLTARNDVPEGENKKYDLYFANVRAAQIPSDTVTKTNVSNNDINVWFNTAATEDISGITKDDVEVQSVENRANKLTVSSVTPMGQSGVKISVSDLNSAAAGEYRVVINKEIHDIFGNDMSKVLFYNKKTTVLTQINNTYDDDNIGTTANSDNFEIVQDPLNANNKVLKMPFKSDANGAKVLNVPAVTENNIENRGIIGTTYRYSLRVNKLQSDSSYWSIMPFLPKGGNGWAQACGTMWFFRNQNNTKYSYLFGTKTNLGEAWDDRVQLPMDWKASTWYDVDIIWNYGSIGESATVTYKISESDTNSVLYEGTYNTPAIDALKQISGDDAVRFIGVRLINNNQMGEVTDGLDHSVLVDDLKVETYKPINAIKSVRFVDVNGDEYAPDATIPNDITQIKIAIDASGITEDNLNGKVKLNGEVKNGVLDTSTNTCTIDLDGILTPTTDYTLSIDELTDLNIPAYSTSFKTSEGSFKITGIKIVDESGNTVALADVTASTKLKVVAEGINTTGSDKTAVVSYGIYNDKMLTGFDFANVTFASTGAKETTEIEISGITDLNKLEIKGFIWDSMKEMTPQSDYTEVK